MGNRHGWPDGFDTAAIVWFIGLVIVMPMMGYTFMVIDIRAYYRALRRALVKVAYHFPQIPRWARHETPGCLKALGLTLPCTEEEIKRNYRQLAKKLHPDRGGDRQKFLTLQKDLESALQFLRDQGLDP